MTDKSQPPSGKASSGARNDERYAELPDASGGYAYDDNRRGPLILAMAAAVLLIFAFVVFNAYKRGVRQGDAAALPQIAAEGPFKTRPDNPGGVGDADTDKVVFDQVDGSARDERFSPRIVREEPVPIDASAGGGLSSKPPNGRSLEPSKPLGGGIGQPGYPVDLRPELKTVDPAPVKKPAPPAPAPSEVAKSAPPAAPVAKPAPPAPKPAPSPQPARASTIFEADGRFVVQLSSLSSRAAADAEWTRVLTKHDGLFAGAQKLVQTADVGDKTYHRLRAGAFATRNDAAAFCDAYKSQGGECLVTTK